MLGTYRDVEVRRGHPLGSILGALAREPHCERVLLRGLEGDEVAELIEAGQAGRDHDEEPVRVSLPRTGFEVDVSFFSRLRGARPSSGTVLG